MWERRHRLPVLVPTERRQITYLALNPHSANRQKMCVSLVARVVWNYMLKSEYFLWFLLWFTFSFCNLKIASIALSCFLLPVCTEGGRLLRPAVLGFFLFFFIWLCLYTYWIQHLLYCADGVFVFFCLQICLVNHLRSVWLLFERGVKLHCRDHNSSGIKHCSIVWRK